MPRLVRVSFDFDDSLTEEAPREYAKNLSSRGFDVWIITARSIKESKDVYKMADRLEISREHVVFTGFDYKYKVIKEVEPIFHIDDSIIENSLIKIKTSTTPINWIRDPKWVEKCEKLLEKYKDKQGFAKNNRRV